MTARKIGLVGGLSWVSTAEYYRALNTLARDRLGGANGASIVLESLNEHAFRAAQDSDPTDRVCGRMVTDAITRLRAAGAEVFALTANGVHRFAPLIRETCGVELVHIARATAARAAVAGDKRVGLLGVMKTMEGTFYPDAMAERGIDVVVPPADARAEIHAKIMDELVMDDFRPATRDLFLGHCRDLTARGAESIVLGCTEIPLLMEGADAPDLTFHSTTAIHCAAIVDAALADD